MVQQITKGIKISVKTTYDGTIHRNQNMYYTFSYYVTIENNSLNTVQLTNRHWEIFDSLSTKEIVDGEGVIGQTPTLDPHDSYTYKSGTFLQSGTGSMSGFFTMKDLDTQKKFNVTIPTFQLSTLVSLN
tara:strand:- start:11357 stop:11743 length:387 start_codon:yes stop_codon:yes gene_type:complete